MHVAIVSSRLFKNTYKKELGGVHTATQGGKRQIYICTYCTVACIYNISHYPPIAISFIDWNLQKVKFCIARM